MKFSEVELPSNKKFGFFFALVFGLVALYFYITEMILSSYTMAALSVVLFVITVVKDSMLLPFNKLWMRFGLLLGIIISPIVLGIIFFGLFTPIAFAMRLSGRDELRLTFRKKSSHWISRKESIQSVSFKNQF